MIPTRGYAVLKSQTPLVPFKFQRREPRDQDVLIEILFCGICHSDLHQARDEWGGTAFPLVPGHEMIGRVTRIGSQVKRFKVGDLAGVGCFVDSCRTCDNCRDGNEQYCDGVRFSYNAVEADGKSRTYGGYSDQIVVDENYVLHIEEGQPLERVAPLLCAGITTYSPLRHWKVTKGQKVGIMGLGGLGHVAVKLAVSFGAEVTMLSTSAKKQSDAQRLGAHHFALTSDRKAMTVLSGHFDLVLDTVSAAHDVDQLLSLLRTNGTWVVLGVPPQPSTFDHFSLIGRRRSIGGSLIGGIRETQEMLDYCASRKILADVEVIPAKYINEAYDRMLNSDVRYRFVIDSKTL